MQASQAMMIVLEDIRSQQVCTVHQQLMLHHLKLGKLETTQAEESQSY